MDNLGSEVGEKMRSAVKAKLIELGTGGLTGYIDDELPDYVMIMIANKRSKQQMIGDLQLFLGSQTELFVTWLHEVLEKLQEVTLPAAVIHKAKRKSDLNDAAIVSKKEKKEKRKDKKPKKISSSTSIEQTELTPPASSISDVFADQFLQKAKKTMQNENLMSTKVKKGDPSSSSSNRITRDEFDIPTITEISESVEEIQRKKDLEELSKIQKKIYQAKAKLKLTEMDESEDEDFINIRAEGEELDDVVTTTTNINKTTDSRKSNRKPIVYDSNEKSSNENKISSNEDLTNEKLQRHEFDKSRKRIPITFSGYDYQRREEENSGTGSGGGGVVVSGGREVVQQRKRPIHERLGFATKNFNSNELNLPILRRLEREREKDREREREKDREREVSSTIRSKSSEKIYENRVYNDMEKEDKNKQREKSPSDESSKIRRRIGSRVIVAPPKKTTFEDSDNDSGDKAVSSMITIKPRPAISPSKQASKNLLLRAVAEAQKSTALVQPKKDSPSSSVRDRSPKRLKSSKVSSKLHTKSFLSRHNRESVKNRLGKSIVIEIKSSNKNINYEHDDNYDDEYDNDRSEDEYIPEPIYDRVDSDHDYVYIPQTINFDNADDDNMSESYDEDRKFSNNKTQFVVTLDDKTRKKFISTQHKNRLLDKCLNGLEKEKATSLNAKTTNNSKMSNSPSYDEDSCLSSYDYSSPRTISHKADDQQQNTKRPITSIKPRQQKVKKIIIKNDTDDDDNIMTNITKESSRKENQQKEKEKEKVKEKENEKEKKKEKVKENTEDGSLTPPLPPLTKRKRSPIKFDLNDDNNKTPTITLSSLSLSSSKRSLSKEKNDDQNTKFDTKDDTIGTSAEENTHKISIKKIEVTKKYENIPESLSSIAVEAPKKTKERCKYFPTCGKGDTCEFFHPTTSCKAFPNCKFVEKCLYLHPKCKFDLTCNRINCNYSHSVPATSTTTSAPPLSSHVVPVQNYKTISANALPAICKYYPNCTNSLCNFYHPKLCRFGKNCMNKVECNFYHFDVPVKDKFKWVASLG